MSVRAALPLGLLLSALTAAAQTPVPAAPEAPQPDAAAAAPEAPVLGRLFFTPDERAHLDELRRRPPPPPPPPAVAAAPEPEQLPPAPRYVTLDGVVRRSDGTSTVWLNNKPVTGHRTDGGLVVSAPSRSAPGDVTLRVPQTGRIIDLKVGQQVEVNSGEVQEGYESPRAASMAAAPAETKTSESPPPASSRRSSRERDLLRDLLREIEGPSSRIDQAPPGEPKPR